MCASKLLMAFPGHAFFRASEELEYLGRARALSPKASLKRGNTYFLLPQTQMQPQNSKPQQWNRSNSKVNPVVSFGSDSEERSWRNKPNTTLLHGRSSRRSKSG
ncbi:hypothetical protein R1flu_027384 [Riccia fluitans]|uniref:Uncharacterized protein n=1 Tax=Riccia fluitans TaxID=41844 RepID=A0ABD1XIR3_9MARC